MPSTLDNPYAEGSEVLAGGAGLAAIEGEGPLVSGTKGLALGVAFHGANKLVQRGARYLLALRDSNEAEGGESQNGPIDVLAAATSDNYYGIPKRSSRMTAMLTSDRAIERTPEPARSQNNSAVREVRGVELVKAEGLAGSVN